MARKSKWGHSPFLGWDGEGATLSRRHQYVALVTDQRVVWTHPKGLQRARAWDALTNHLHERRDAIHVGFAFSYDSNMLLSGVPRSTLLKLWDTGEAYHENYRIEYRPRKSFGLWRQVFDTRGNFRWIGGRIWDVFGFFQSSFLTALSTWNIGSEAERESIAVMKAQRARFRAKDLPALVRYSQLECAKLVELMDAVRNAANAAGLQWRRWDGAGAVAAALLERHRAGNILPPAILPTKTPGHSPRVLRLMRDAAQSAYFGGRIECGVLGHHTGRVIRYDVRSAYPWALASMPPMGLDDGRWVACGPNLPEDVGTPALYRVRWRGGSADKAGWHPFPWRARDGRVFFPPEGAGWVWPWELSAARRYWGGQVQVLDGWLWESRDTYPWAWIPEQFEQRARWKAAGHPAEKVLKLGLNSVYGKLAQHLGGDEETAPRYHAVEVAGAVTARVRARLYEAVHIARGAGRRVFMLATDAIFTDGPVPALDRDCGSALGQWERTDYDGATILQSGVYWLHHGQEVTQYARGLDAATFTPDAVRTAWRKDQSSIAVPTRRFQTLGACVGSEKSMRRWQQWVDSVRSVDVGARRGQKRVYFGQLRPLAREVRPTIAAQPIWSVQGWNGTDISAPVSYPWRPVVGAPSPYPINALDRAESEMDDGEE